MQKRPQARRSLPSNKSCDEPEEEGPSNRAEKKPVKKAGRLVSDDLQRDKVCKGVKLASYVHIAVLLLYTYVHTYALYIQYMRIHMCISSVLVE